MGRTRARYDDEYRANAVLMLEAAGYPEKKGALVRTAKELQIPPATLSRWGRMRNNPPPPELVKGKKEDLLQSIFNECNAILGEMPDARQDAGYRDLGTVFGILTDKALALTGSNGNTEKLTITFERAGTTSLPQHLARLPNGSREEL